MKGHTDQWIENRILWAARRNELPTGAITLYKQSATLPLSLVGCSGKVGVPVLAIVGDDDHWTLLGTDRIIASIPGAITDIGLDDINGVESPRDKEALRPGKCEILGIKDIYNTIYPIWVPAGREYYAIMNILGMLMNMKRK